MCLVFFLTRQKNEQMNTLYRLLFFVLALAFFCHPSFWSVVLLCNHPAKLQKKKDRPVLGIGIRYYPSLPYL
jgi:hypothetical protein